MRWSRPIRRTGLTMRGAGINASEPLNPVEDKIATKEIIGPFRRGYRTGVRFYVDALGMMVRDETLSIGDDEQHRAQFLAISRLLKTT